MDSQLFINPKALLKDFLRNETLAIFIPGENDDDVS